MNMNSETVKTPVAKRVPMWVRWIPAVVLIALLYFVSIGPAFRLYTHGKLGHSAMLFYKPLLSTHSPLFEVTRDYLVEWVS